MTMLFPSTYPRLAQTLPECLYASYVSGREVSSQITYPGELLRLLRLGHNPSHHEHESDYRKPQPF